MFDITPLIDEEFDELYTEEEVEEIKAALEEIFESFDLV